MQKEFTFKLKPAEAVTESIIKKYIASAAGIPENAVSGYTRLHQSVDARSRQQVWVNLKVNAFINEPFYKRNINTVLFKPLNPSAKKVIIIGTGPAGLFAALQLLELGIQPILIERGKDVRARRRDLALLNKVGLINPDSNYCFGEGGAGTYSDGKLYTRSNKRGNINRILNLFFQFGADENILFEAHPHIGTNKLPHIITAIREQILNCGGIMLFENRVTDLILENNTIKGIINQSGDHYYADAVILATGHSARDIFEMLHQKNIIVEAKPFALGVRVEHPQSLIDAIQYHCPVRDQHLPPSSYSLVEQVNGKGVFSFCMCPGGIIATASTHPEELVVNGWSPSKRNNPYANSGMVVSVSQQDAFHYLKTIRNIDPSRLDSPLSLMYFQQLIEQNAFKAGGGKFVAPAARMTDFSENRMSVSLPGSSYIPGLHAADLSTVLPAFIFRDLQEGFKAFGKKMHGYYSNEAIVVATESRTSSPVRIPRNEDNLQHIQIKNLYPCGEGAGYAGGIVSAAMDGEKVASMIALTL